MYFLGLQWKRIDYGGKWWLDSEKLKGLYGLEECLGRMGRFFEVNSWGADRVRLCFHAVWKSQVEGEVSERMDSKGVKGP